MQDHNQPYTGRHQKQSEYSYGQPAQPVSPVPAAVPARRDPRGSAPDHPRRHTRFHMPRGRYDGRWWMIFGALLLLGLTVYEFVSRMDTIVKLVSGFRQAYVDLNLAELSGIPFTRYLYQTLLRTEGGTAVINIMIFLAACIVFSVVCICLRNRPMACYVLLAGDVALFLSGVVMRVFYIDLINMIIMLKMIPMAMILTGCLINIIQFYYRRHGYLRNAGQSPAGAQPYIRPAAIPVPPSPSALPPQQSGAPVLQVPRPVQANDPQYGPFRKNNTAE